MGPSTKRLLTAGCAGLALLVLPAEAALGSTTWDGRCSITGLTTFDDPIGVLPAPVTYRDRGTGTCTGTLNGVAVHDAPIELRARGKGFLGCLGGTSVMPGRIIFTQGTERQSDDVSMGYVGEGVGVFPNYISRARGTRSGHSISYVSMLGRSGLGQADACGDGSLRSAGWDAVTQTLGLNEG